MSSFEHNMDLLLPFMVSSWILCIASVFIKPQRIVNSFLLLTAVLFTMLTIAGMFGDDMMTALAVMAVIIFFLLLSTPVLLIANGVIVMKREGRSVANSLSMILGFLIAIGEAAVLMIVFNNGIYKIDHIFYKVMLFTGNTAFFFSTVVLAFVAYNLFIQYIPKTIDFDYVIIHGCGLIDGTKVSPLLASRIDKAIDVYNGCKNKPVIIPSGGQGSDESMSEAAAMTDYLIAHGIPEEHIVPEDRSTTTMENLANCKEYIEAESGGKKKRIALVSSNYHVYRCLLYAEKIKMKCIGIGSHVAWFYWPSALLREFAAVFSHKKQLIILLITYVLLIVLPTISMFSFQ